MSPRSFIPSRTLLERDEMGIQDLQRQLFRRAYVDGQGAFTTVINRLSAGASILVRLPGRFMKTAAAELRRELPNYGWEEYLEAPHEKEGIEEVWQRTTQLVGLLRKHFSPDPKVDTRLPAAIFHNLDLLGDGRGALLTYPYVQTALLSLMEGARHGVVVGFADRDEPDLPPSLGRVFSETVRLDEIPYENFSRLVPRSLASELEGGLSEDVVWQLYVRLRFLDPWRAFRIMEDAATPSLADVFRRIEAATRTVNFVIAAPNSVGGPPAPPTGSEDGKTVSLRRWLYERFILPFQSWRNVGGSRHEWETRLRLLPAGTILWGPPGTGKTHHARWVAEQIGLPVRIVSGGEIRAAEWGEAERRVRKLFDELRRAAPCVLILDEADDLLSARDEQRGGLASAERAVVGEFLQQLEGVRGRLDGVLVIATTNRYANLDPAIQQRLSPARRVPFPQERDEVQELVDHFAEEYRFDVSAVHSRLVGFFFQNIPGASVGKRFNDDSGWFSPREIDRAMRMLATWAERAPGTKQVITEADIDKLEEHYKRAAEERTA